MNLLREAITNMSQPFAAVCIFVVIGIAIWRIFRVVNRRLEIADAFRHDIAMMEERRKTANAKLIESKRDDQ